MIFFDWYPHNINRFTDSKTDLSYPEKEHSHPSFSEVPSIQKYIIFHGIWRFMSLFFWQRETCSYGTLHSFRNWTFPVSLPDSQGPACCGRESRPVDFQSSPWQSLERLCGVNRACKFSKSTLAWQPTQKPQVQFQRMWRGRFQSWNRAHPHWNHSSTYWGLLSLSDVVPCNGHTGTCNWPILKIGWFLAELYGQSEMPNRPSFQGCGK